MNKAALEGNNQLTTHLNSKEKKHMQQITNTYQLQPQP